MFPQTRQGRFRPHLCIGVTSISSHLLYSFRSLFDRQSVRIAAQDEHPCKQAKHNNDPCQDQQPRPAAKTEGIFETALVRFGHLAAPRTVFFGHPLHPWTACHRPAPRNGVQHHFLLRFALRQVHRPAIFCGSVASFPGLYNIILRA